MLISLLFASALLISEDSIRQAFDGHEGALVLADCATGETFRSDAAACAEKITPCSTFKIWNAAIGSETGLITSADEPFWKWDGTIRSVAAWNGEQTVRSAFAASCVPAYQALARKIGKKRMQEGLDLIVYGNRDISSGVDLFWLPAPGRKTILISPDEQAELIGRLVKGKLPFSSKTTALLKEVMRIKTTDHGTLYGKTGSGTDAQGNFNLGLFVGFVESSGKTVAFACVMKGNGVMSKQARAAVESILTQQKLL